MSTQRRGEESQENGITLLWEEDELDGSVSVFRVAIGTLGPSNAERRATVVTELEGGREVIPILTTEPPCDLPPIVVPPTVLVQRPPLSANVRETRSTQRIRVGRRQRKRTLLGLRERMEENGSAPGTGEAKRSAAAPADPEVVDRPLRRRFSPSYKLRIVEEADRCTEPGEVGQVLRREGLYSSHLTTWRKAAHSGSLKALSKKRGRKPERNPLDEKVRKLERRNARLENELRKAHLIIDVQGKVAGLLGISLDDGTNS